MRGRRVSVAVAVAFAVLGAPAARACAGAGTAPSASTPAKVRKATICLINKERRKAGLKKVRGNRKLMIAGDRHSTDMVAKQYFEHDGPSGDTFITRATAAGYLTGKEREWGLNEALAFGTGDKAAPRTIVRAWMNSPVHRAVVLAPKARDAGIGMAAGTPSGDAGGTTFSLEAGYIKR